MNALTSDGATSLFLATASVDPFQGFVCGPILNVLLSPLPQP